jgi:hypothetical protein
MQSLCLVAVKIENNVLFLAKKLDFEFDLMAHGFFSFNVLKLLSNMI